MRNTTLSKHLSWLRFLLKKEVPDFEIVKAVEEMFNDMDRETTKKGE